MIEPMDPTMPQVTPAQQAATQSSGGDQVVEAVVNLAVEGGIEAITGSGDLVGSAVVAGVGAVGSLFGSIFESL